MFKVSSNYPKWFYYYWIKQHLAEFQRIASDKTTTMGHIKRGHLSEALVIVPNDEILDTMSKIMSPIIEKTVILKLECQTLSELCDVLISRLIVGEINALVEDN